MATEKNKTKKELLDELMKLKKTLNDIRMNLQKVESNTKLKRDTSREIARLMTRLNAI